MGGGIHLLIRHFTDRSVLKELLPRRHTNPYVPVSVPYLIRTNSNARRRFKGLLSNS